MHRGTCQHTVGRTFDAVSAVLTRCAGQKSMQTSAIPAHGRCTGTALLDGSGGGRASKKANGLTTVASRSACVPRSALAVLRPGAGAAEAREAGKQEVRSRVLARRRRGQRRRGGRPGALRVLEVRRRRRCRPELWGRAAPGDSLSGRRSLSRKPLTRAAHTPGQSEAAMVPSVPHNCGHIRTGANFDHYKGPTGPWLLKSASQAGPGQLERHA